MEEKNSSSETSFTLMGILVKKEMAINSLRKTLSFVLNCLPFYQITQKYKRLHRKDMQPLRRYIEIIHRVDQIFVRSGQ